MNHCKYHLLILLLATASLHAMDDLTRLFASTSLHAMDDISLTNYNPMLHSQATQRIFFTAFPDAEELDAAIASPHADHDHKTVTIIEKNNTAIGFIIHHRERLSGRQACPDFYDTTYANILSHEFYLNICRISYVAVDPEYRKRGYARYAVNQLTKQAQLNGDDVIALAATHNIGFFEKNGFMQTASFNGAALMAQPLNENTVSLLRTIVFLRNGRNRITTINRFVV